MFTEKQLEIIADAVEEQLVQYQQELVEVQ